MSKQKKKTKKGGCKKVPYQPTTTEKILLATAIIELIRAIFELLEKLTE